MSSNERKRRREIAVGVAAKKVPLVSVVIPMYNSARFIPQTLESLLYQTMTDFEVVVVDDCSTDNSVEVVESFSERFGGRLRVVKLRQNTGTPGLPRNVGINFAHGKYIAFLDSDDLYTKTALEELSTLAEEYQADVIRTNSWFVLWNDRKKSVDDPAFINFAELTNPANFTTKNEHDPNTLTAPKLESEDIGERVKAFVNWGTFWMSWLSFYRREFLIANKIQFPPMLKFEDASFVLECFLLAKKFLRVPNAVYINRPRVASISRVDDKNIDIRKYFHENILSLNCGFNELERVMDKIAFFKTHSDSRYAVLNFFAEKSFSFAWVFQNVYSKIPTFKLNDLVKQEFHSDDAALVAYLFNSVNVHRLQIMSIQQEINRLKQEASHGKA